MMGVVARSLGVDDVDFLQSIDIQLILLMSMVSSMGSIASPALPAMTGTLGIDPARIGLVFTAFTLPAIFALPAVGAIADMYNRRAVVVPGLLLFGVAGLAVGLVTEFWAILVLRGLQGIGYTAFNSLTVALLGDRLTGQPESAAQGVRVLLNKVTGFVGPTVAGVLAAVAWNYPFFLYGLAIPVGLLVYVYLERPTGDDAPATAANGGERRSLTAYLRDMSGLVRDPFIAAILAGGFFRMVMKYALYTFLALAVVQQYDGSVGYAGFLVGLYSLIGAVVASQSARFTGSMSHSYALVAGFAIAGVAFVAFPLAGGLVALTVLVLVHGVGEGIINPVHKSIMSQSVTDDVRAGLVTTNAIVQNTAKTITPVVLGGVLVVLGESAYDQLFLLTGAVTLVATVIALGALVVGHASRRRAAL
jgi:MFS family permease